MKDASSDIRLAYTNSNNSNVKEQCEQIRVWKVLKYFIGVLRSKSWDFSKIRFHVIASYLEHAKPQGV